MLHFRYNGLQPEIDVFSSFYDSADWSDDFWRKSPFISADRNLIEEVVDMSVVDSQWVRPVGQRRGRA